MAASCRFSPNLELVSINHLMYGAVYDVDGGDDLHMKRVDDSYYKYNSFNRIVREIYLSCRTSKLDLMLGKQQIAWAR